MKIKLSLVFAVLLISTAIFAQQKKVHTNQPSNKPALKGTIFFESTSYNFKDVNEDLGRTQASFTFKNIGKGDLHIDNIESNCGCTSAIWDKNKIYKQGESGSVMVSFNPKNLEGPFTRTLSVRSDGDPGITFLTIEGSVFGPTKEKNIEFPYAYGGLRFSMNVISMKHVLDDRHDSVSLQIYNPSDKRIQLKSIKSPNYFKGKLYSTYIEPKGYEVIKFIMMPEVAKIYGPIEEQITLLTDDKELPNKIVVLKAEIAENFDTKTADEKKKTPKIIYKESVKDLGEVYYGEVVDYDFEVTNKGKSDLILRRAYGTCGCTVGKVPTEPIKKGKKGIVSVRFDAKNLIGNQVKTITVISNDPVNPTTTLTIKAKLVEPGAKK